MDPFALEDRWTPVSARLLALRRTVLAASAAAVGLLNTTGWLLLGLLAHGRAAVVGFVVTSVVLGAAAASGFRMVGRSCRAWGYAERDEDLLVVRGWLFRRLVVVPYGRMQFVDVSAGPLQRRYGVATLQVHTAAAASDARIPGLPPGEAHRLRDTLARLGEARSAGL